MCPRVTTDAHAKNVESRREKRNLRAVNASVRAEDDGPEKRRARESGGPDDRAMYTCSCGYVFEADVTTSVACPHCGAGQAW
jgi:rubrerythrin